MEDDIILNLHNLGSGNGFIDMTPKAQQRKEINDSIQSQNFCVSKHTIKKVKRQHMDWEIFSANYPSDKELVYRIYKELLKLNNKSTLPN